MKRLFYKIAFVILFSGLAITGCKKDDNNSTPANNISTIITSGSWRVSYYHESGDDHTSNFNGYSFIFNANGTMTATNSAGTTTGTWSCDDSHNEFHMSCGNSSPLSELNHGWLVVSKSNIEFQLRDDNPSDDKELHFTKI